jgi:sarcosine oxidase
VRLSFTVRGEPPARLPCLLDSAAGAYGDPLPGNAAYAVGIGETPVHEDGGVLEPAELAAEAERVIAYVAETLPGLDPEPFEARHCWVTELPWSHDGIAVWERDALLVPAGNNLFKHAPVLGRLLAAAALDGELDPRLRTVARLGSVTAR